MLPHPEAIAVIDGTLCQLKRDGSRAAWHAPLATAVVEFLPGALCYFVRELPYGLLPGLPNLYCLGGDLTLQWMAEWPLPADPCAAIVREEGGILVARSLAGIEVRLDGATGRLLGWCAPLAAAS